MNKQSGRIGLYLVLIVMLVAGYFYLNNQVASQSSYSMESMKQAAEDGKLSSAKIYQNREVPTGSVVADIEGEGKKKVYVRRTEASGRLRHSSGSGRCSAGKCIYDNIFSGTSHRWAGDFPVSYDEPSDVRRRR